MISGAPIHTVTAGKFSCEFGKGNNEPKFFSLKAASSKGGFSGVLVCLPIL